MAEQEAEQEAPLDGHDGPLLSTDLGVDGLAVVPRAQYRLRFRHFEAHDFSEDTQADALLHRARLGLGVDWKQRVGAFVQVHDVRYFGQDPGTEPFGLGFDLHQGYARVMPFDGFEIRLGRQQIAYENERLIGHDDWSEPGRAFDAVRFSFSEGIVTIDSFYAKLFDFPTLGPVPGGVATDIDLLAGNLHLAIRREIEIGLLVIERAGGPAPGFRLRTLTFGGLLRGETRAGLDYALEGYGQLQDTGAERVGRAFMAATRLGYTAEVTTRPFLRVFAEYLSGVDARLKDPTTFETLYGSPHLFHGEMDFFTDIRTDTADRGLLDVGGSLGLSPTEGLTITPSYHYFRSADSSAVAGAWGHEIDAKIGYRPWRYLALDLGYGAFFPGELFKAMRGDSVEHLVYSTVDASF